MRRTLAVTAILLATGCAGVRYQPPSAPPEHIAEYAEDRTRRMVEAYNTPERARATGLHLDIARLAATSDDCERRGGELGLIVEVVDEAWPPVVLAVVPGSPAEKAGVVPGSGILHVSGEAADGRLPGVWVRQERRYVEWDGSLALGTAGALQLAEVSRRYDGIMKRVLWGSPVELRTMLHDSTTTVSMTGDLICDYPLIVTDDSAPVAFTSGERIYLSKGMARLASTDSQLAFVLAHELAHHLLDHGDKKTQNAALGALLGAAAGAVVEVIATEAGVETGPVAQALTALGTHKGALSFSQDFEAEADYVALHIVAALGLPLDGIEDLWRELDVASGFLDGGDTHPSYASRYARTIATVEAVKAKAAAGQVLFPMERPYRQN